MISHLVGHPPSALPLAFLAPLGKGAFTVMLFAFSLGDPCWIDQSQISRTLFGTSLVGFTSSGLFHRDMQ